MDPPKILICTVPQLLCFFSYSIQAQNDSLKFQLSPVVITSLRTPVSEKSVPYSFAVTKARQDIQGISLAEVVAGVPGLEVQARYNFSVGDRITNRGFGARTQFGVRGVRIILDDIPLTMADGQTNLEMIDLQNLSEIELLRGPGSSLYGNSSGGVLKLYSNPITTAPLRMAAALTNGQFGLFRWNVSAGSSMGKTNIDGNFNSFEYGGYREHSRSKINRTILRYKQILSSKDILSITAGYVNFSALSPGALTEAEVHLNPTLANPFSVSNQAGEDGLQFQLGASWKHNYSRGSMVQLIAYDSYRFVKNLIAGKIIQLPQTDAGINVLLDDKINLLGKKSDWTSGIDLAFRYNNRKNFVNVAGTKGNLFMNQNEGIAGIGIFSQVLMPLSSKLDVAGSLRYDLADFFVTDLFKADSIDNSGNRIMKGLSPSAGIIYHFSGLLNWYTNISTSFETPTSTELANRPGGIGGFNPGLHPSRAVEYEAGLRGKYSTFHYDLTGYIIQIRDELIPFEVTPDVPGGQVYYRNAGSSVHRGFEISLDYFPVSSMEIQSGFTYINASFKNYEVHGTSYSGKKVPGITPVRISTSLTFTSPHQIYVSFLGQSFGRVFADDANTAQVAPYAIFGLDAGHAGFPLVHRLKLMISVGISNIFNTLYISSVTVNANAGRYFEPAPGRAVYVNAKIELM